MALTTALRNAADARRTALWASLNPKRAAILARDGKQPQLLLAPRYVPEDGATKPVDAGRAARGRPSPSDEGIALPASATVSTAVDEYVTPSGEKGNLTRQMVISEGELWMRVLDEDGHAPELAHDWQVVRQEYADVIISESRSN